MPPGRVTEAALTGGGGGKGGGSNCDHHLQDTLCPSLLLQVPWESYVGVVRRLAFGSSRPTESATEVGATDQGVSKIGRGCTDLGKDLCGSGSDIFSVWVGDVGNDTTHWEWFGRISPQGGPQAGVTETAEGHLWEMEVSPAGGGNGVGRVTGGGDLRLLPVEHSHAVH